MGHNWETEGNYRICENCGAEQSRCKETRKKRNYRWEPLAGRCINHRLAVSHPVRGEDDGRVRGKIEEPIRTSLILKQEQVARLKRIYGRNWLNEIRHLMAEDLEDVTEKR